MVWPSFTSYVAVSGGIFRDCSVHDFDIVRWIVGREVVEVYATGTNHGEAMFAEACSSGWEGVIAKRADSVYTDKRSRDWLKFKCEHGQELVVGTLDFYVRGLLSTKRPHSDVVLAALLGSRPTPIALVPG